MTHFDPIQGETLMLGSLCLTQIRLRSHARTLCLILYLIISIPCSAVQSQPRSDESEARLRERITAYWHAIETGEFEKASEYVHPDSR